VGRERVLCFRAANGKLLWKYEYPCTYRISCGSGPGWRTWSAVSMIGADMPVPAVGRLVARFLSNSRT
jgi:hypothetical protein